MSDTRGAAHPAMAAGVAAGILANMTWGLGFLIPVLLSAFNPVAITLGRYLSYGLVSVVFALVAGYRMRYRASVWRKAVLFASGGNIIYYFSIVQGLALVGAPVVAVILGTLPVTVTLYANHRNRDYPFRTLVLPLLLIGFGLVLVNAVEVDWSGLGERSLGEQLLGIGCAVASLVLWTWFSVANSAFLKANQDISPAEWSTVIGVVTLVLSVAALPVVLAGNSMLVVEPAAPRSSWWWLAIGTVLLGVLVSWLATLLWNRASVLLPMTLAGQLVVFETLSGLGYVFAATGRVPPLLELAGIAMVTSGVLVGLRRARARTVAGPTGIRPTRCRPRHRQRRLNDHDTLGRARQVSITLPEDLIDAVKAAVERGEARSMSSYIAARLTPGVAMDALFAEWDVKRGAPDAEVGQWADQELDRAFAEQAARDRGTA